MIFIAERKLHSARFLSLFDCSVVTIYDKVCDIEDLLGGWDLSSPSSGGLDSSSPSSSGWDLSSPSSGGWDSSSPSLDGWDSSSLSNTGAESPSWLLKKVSCWSNCNLSHYFNSAVEDCEPFNPYSWDMFQAAISTDLTNTTHSMSVKYWSLFWDWNIYFFVWWTNN